MSSKPPRVARGDVIEVDLSDSRYAYLQDIGKGWGFRLVRFLPGVYARPLRRNKLVDLVEGDTLYKSHCLVELLLLEDGARVLQNLPIPDEAKVFPAMVARRRSDDWHDWWVREPGGSQVSASDYLLRHPDSDLTSLAETNDTPGPRTLRARIEAGWTPSNRVSVEAAVAKKTVGGRIAYPQTLYLAYFPDKQAMREFASAVGDDVEVFLSSDDQDGLWEARIVRRGHLSRALVAKLTSLAADFGGFYDGDVDISG